MLPFFFIFTLVKGNSRSASVITEKRIHPAACAIPAQQAVFCSDSAKNVVNNDTERVFTVYRMVNSLIDNKNQYPFFICSRRIQKPECAIFFIAIGVEEFPVKGVVPFLELL